MVRTLATLIVLGSVSAAPEVGCYYYKFPNPKMDIQAQVEIKSTSQMDFSVYMKTGKQEISHLCVGESFSWTEADQTMVVGEPASECLLKLQSMTFGALTLPVSFNYSAGSKSFKATFLGVPVELVKVSTCGTLPIRPTEAPTTPSPNNNNGGNPADPASGSADTQTTTKSFESVTIGFVMIISLLGML